MANTPTLKDQYQSRLANSQSQINDLYDKQYQSQAASLKTAYDKNMSDLQAQKDLIPQTYRNQSNALAQQYEQARHNANLNAMNSGLASGTAQQQQNALSNNYVSNYAGIQANRAAALNQANTSMADLSATYRQNLADTLNKVNTTRDSALIKDKDTQRQWLDEQAKTFASYGDFSGYEALYGEDQAHQMRSTWIAQNPVLAYNMGMISKEDFKKLTGKGVSSIKYTSPYRNLTVGG